MDLIESMPHPALPTLQDEDLPPGIRCYLKSGFAAELTDALIDIVVEHTQAMPSPSSSFDCHHMGRVVARIPDDATAFGDRRSAYCFNVVGAWKDPVDNAVNRDWVRALASTAEPFGTGGTYVNFTADPNRVRAAYSDTKYQRLRAVKREYDPGTERH